MGFTELTIVAYALSEDEGRVVDDVFIGWIKSTWWVLYDRNDAKQLLFFLVLFGA